jgi:hypothetical protein
MGRKQVAAAFVVEAQDHFAFLGVEGFLGPERSDCAIIFHSPGLAIEVALDQRAREVVTIVRATGERDLIAELSCLYVEAGLGPSQHVPRNVTSEHSLKKVLGAQSEALAKLLPAIQADPYGREVIERCHRR